MKQRETGHLKDPRWTMLMPHPVPQGLLSEGDEDTGGHRRTQVCWELSLLNLKTPTLLSWSVWSVCLWRGFALTYDVPTAARRAARGASWTRSSTKAPPFTFAKTRTDKDVEKETQESFLGLLWKRPFWKGWSANAVARALNSCNLDANSDKDQPRAEKIRKESRKD